MLNEQNVCLVDSTQNETDENPINPGVQSQNPENSMGSDPVVYDNDPESRSNEDPIHTTEHSNAAETVVGETVVQPNKPHLGPTADVIAGDKPTEQRVNEPERKRRGRPPLAPGQSKSKRKPGKPWVAGGPGRPPNSVRGGDPPRAKV